MKILKTLVLALFAISTFSLQAKDNEVTLIVTSEGVNKDDAITNALRSAIEQTYGVFVSADTHILNDELVKDEIATISSGNIKSYKELGSTVMSSGQTSVTLEATVSVGKLISYVKSKGAECEFDGASFAQNITLDELYMQNERKVLDDLTALIKKSMPNLYDAKVTVQPAAKNPNSPLYEFIADVELEGNENLTALWTQIKNTLESISLRAKDYIIPKKMMTPGRLLKQPLVMQFKSKKSKITDYDVNRYYYPIATVYKNLGLGRTGNPYDDPQDKAKKDTENTAICFTRTDFDKWENDLWRDLRLLVSRIYISNQEGEKLETKLVQHSPEANFATPYSSSDSGVSYGGRKIIVLPKNLMYRFSFSLPKEEIKKFKSFKVGIQ